MYGSYSLRGFRVNITEYRDTNIPTAHTLTHIPCPQTTYTHTHPCTHSLHAGASVCTHPCFHGHTYAPTYTYTHPCSCAHLCTHAHIYFRTSCLSFASCSFGQGPPTWDHTVLSVPLGGVGVVWMLSQKSFSPCPSLTVLQPGSPRAMTSSSGASFPSIFKLGLMIPTLLASQGGSEHSHEIREKRVSCKLQIVFQTVKCCC